jgi:hypothetical protein
MKKIRMLWKYCSHGGNGISIMLNLGVVLQGYLTIPALIIHEFSHLFFVMLTFSRWQVVEFKFLVPSRTPQREGRERSLALQTCISFGTVPSTWWAGILIGIAPAIAFGICIALTFVLLHGGWLWAAGIYLVLARGTFAPSEEDIISIFKSMARRKFEQGMGSKGISLKSLEALKIEALTKAKEFAERGLGMDAKTFDERMESNPGSLLMELKEKAFEIQSKERKLAGKTPEDMDEDIRQLQEKIMNELKKN